MRLIDADALLTQLRRIPLFERTERDKGMFYVERSCIDAMPTIDAVPVVRCKDCLYWQSGENESEKWEYCTFHNIDIGPHSFCSYGERKE